MRAHLFTLVLALLLTGCRSTNTKVDELIATSTRLTLVDSVLYLDGGSVSYIFTNQGSAPVVVFLPNTDRSDHSFRKDGKTLQRVFIASKVEFKPNEVTELVLGSRQERELIELVQGGVQDEMPLAHREALRTVLLVLKERRFEWDTIQD